MSIFFDSRMTAEEIVALLKQRNRTAVKDLLYTLRDNNATEEQLAGVKCLSGMKNSLGAPVGSNAPLRDYGAERMTQGMAKLLTSGPTATCEYIRFDFSSDESDIGFLLPALKRAVEPQLKREFQHYVALFRPIVTLTGAYPSLQVIGWRAATSVIEGVSATRKIRTLRTVVPVTNRMTLLNTPSHLAAAVATLWDLTVFDEPNPKAMQLHGFLMQAQIRMPRIAFGHNLGKKLGPVDIRFQP